MQITVTNNLGQVIEALESAIVGCSDFRPLWEDLRVPWEQSRRLMYLTRGRSTGAPWPSYGATSEADWYVWYKAAVMDITIEQPSDLDKWMLAWKGAHERLRPSLTDTRARFAIWRPEPLSLTMGSRAPGAAQNNDGTGTAPRRMGGHPIPERPLLRFGRPFVADTGRAMGNHAARIAATVGRTRSGLTTAQVLARLSGRLL